MSKTKQKKVNPYAKQPEKKTNWPLIIVAVVLVAALIVAGVLLLGGKHKNTADDGLLQGDKGNGGEGKRNLPFCSDRQGQKGGMDNGEGVNACTDGRGTGRRRRACLYAPGNRT